MNFEFDLICIGSGPAGQRAAVQAAKLGKKVAIIEKFESVGGACLHHGTIPSKTFRETALSESIKNEKKTILKTKNFLELSNKEFFSRIEKIIDYEVSVNFDQLSRNGIKIIFGEASFINKNKIIVRKDKESLFLNSEFILISVGTETIQPKFIVNDKESFLTSDDIFELKKIPNDLIIIGCGVIGIEYASIFAKLGVKVEVIDGRNRPLEFLDYEIVDQLIFQMRQEGVVFKFGEKVKKVLLDKMNYQRVLVYLESGEVLNSELAILCAGREGSTDSLALDKVNVKRDDRKRIIVDKFFRSSTKNIFAAGDVIGYPSLAATSFEQGRLAALYMFEQRTKPMSPNFPFGIYSIPEVSMVGLPEHQLTKKKIPYETGIARYKEISRGNIIGDKFGLLKMNFHSENKKLLGVHIVGTSATELIHIGQSAIELGGDLDYFLSTVFNYPTLAECYKVAALDASNKFLEKEERF